MDKKCQQVPVLLVENCIWTELHGAVGFKQDSTNIMSPFFKKEAFYVKAAEQYSAEARTCLLLLWQAACSQVLPIVSGLTLVGILESICCSCYFI